ncbi:regulatory protein YcgZ [Pantoea dispersa]|uniref:regulatory protein YcgZ n=1 Tax=Pantoea dispersa TaxID=59814 RepID=UPI002DC0374D|nr:regulatory protein YcgZ [Pantoea dispersa]MEB5970488.1 regulatory protein YcgZ [Pantoea dispersa]
MRQNVTKFPDSASEIAQYFSRAATPTQQETLGQIVVEILRAGKNLNRKAICSRLLRRLEVAANHEEERHYHTLIGMLFER